jgi:hypothetical protein
MTPRLRATLEHTPDLMPRIELRRDGLAARSLNDRHRRAGTRYRHAEDERGEECWYRIEVGHAGGRRAPARGNRGPSGMISA